MKGFPGRIIMNKLKYIPLIIIVIALAIIIIFNGKNPKFEGFDMTNLESGGECGALTYDIAYKQLSDAGYKLLDDRNETELATGCKMYSFSASDGTRFSVLDTGEYEYEKN